MFIVKKVETMVRKKWEGGHITSDTYEIHNSWGGSQAWSGRCKLNYPPILKLTVISHIFRVSAKVTKTSSDSSKPVRRSGLQLYASSPWLDLTTLVSPPSPNVVFAVGAFWHVVSHTHKALPFCLPPLPCSTFLLELHTIYHTISFFARLVFLISSITPGWPLCLFSCIILKFWRMFSMY